MHGDLQEMVKQLGQQLTGRMSTDTDKLKQALEGRQEQLKLVGETNNMYWDQVNRVLVLTGNAGNDRIGGYTHKGSEILQFSGTNRGAVHGCMAQVATQITDDPKQFLNETWNVRCTASSIEEQLLNYIQLFITTKSGNLTLD